MAVVSAAGLSPVVLGAMQGKDSRWLTLEVCREFARSKCSRTDEECKYAHPPPHVEIQNGRVTCCFDSIKGKCQRREPPCKYLHPPQHLKEQLLQNGRQNLILKNLQMQGFQATMATGLQPVMQVPAGMIPVMYEPGGGLKQLQSVPNVQAIPSMPAQPTYQNMILNGQYVTMQIPQTMQAAPSQYFMHPGMPAAGYQYYSPASLGAFTGMVPAIEAPPVSVANHLASGSSGMSNGLIGQPLDSRTYAKRIESWSIGSLPVPTSYGYQLQNVSYDGQPAQLQQVQVTSTSSTNSASTSTTSQRSQGGASWDGASSPSPSMVAVDGNNSTAAYQPIYYQSQVVEVLAPGVGRKRL